MSRKKNHVARAREDRLWPAVAIALALFVGFVYINWSDVPFVVGGAICLLAVALAGHFLGWKPLTQVTLTTVFFFAFVLLCGIASIYSPFGEQAATEFARWLIALFLFLIAAIACKKKHSHALMVGVTLAIGLVAVFSIDSASWKEPTEFFLGTLLRNDTAAYSYWPDGRISGLFVNPNITGSMFAVGMLLSLHLARGAKRTGERVAMYATLAVSALGFLLSFSMGSIGFFLVAVVVYLIAVGKKERPGLFVLMVETFLVTMVFGVISTLGLGKTGAVALLPDVCMVLATVALWLLDTKVGVRVSEKLAQNGRAAVIGLSTVAALGVIYLVAGFSLAGGMTFQPGEGISRSAYPAPGDYTLSVEGGGDLMVSIATQNSQQTAMHTETEVYAGVAQGAAFTVPEGTKVAHFRLSSPAGGQVDAVTYAGAEEGALKLNYLLIPEFAATRIQGLWANQNVIQRGTFNEDALRIWRESPILGSGMGAFEMRHDSVADFFYITRYTHNVYTQTLAETGLVGLVLLLGALAAFFLACIKGRKEEENGALAAPLLACLVMLAGHGSFEVIWSSPPYMLMVPLLLALVQVNFGHVATLPLLGKKGVRATCAALCGVCAVFFAWAYLQPTLDDAAVARYAREQDYVKFITRTERAAKHGIYNSDKYSAAYLENVFLGGEEALFPIADAIAAQMPEQGMYEYGMRAARYYFERGENAPAFDALERSALRFRANPAAWDKAVETMMDYCVPDSDTPGRIQGFYALWQEVEARQLDELPLTASHMSYLTGFLTA